jgi:hypothetical protein
MRIPHLTKSQALDGWPIIKVNKRFLFATYPEVVIDLGMSAQFRGTSDDSPGMSTVCRTVRWAIKIMELDDFCQGTSPHGQ